MESEDTEALRPLSAEALVSCVGLTLSFHDTHKLSRYFSRWRSLALLPSILPGTTKFSRPCLLMPHESKLPLADSFH